MITEQVLQNTGLTPDILLFLSGNIFFIDENGKTKADEWSKEYHLTVPYSESGSAWSASASKRTEWAYAEPVFQHKYSWENRSSAIIMPYYVLNAFPWKYEKPQQNNRGDRNSPQKIVVLSDAGDHARPMPSLDKTERNPKTITVKVQLGRDFSLNSSGGYENRMVIELEILYKQRWCHMLHDGTVTNNATDNTGSFTEHQGPIANYSELKTEYTKWVYDTLKESHAKIVDMAMK